MICHLGFLGFPSKMIHRWDVRIYAYGGESFLTKVAVIYGFSLPEVIFTFSFLRHRGNKKSWTFIFKQHAPWIYWVYYREPLQENNSCAMFKLSHTGLPAWYFPWYFLGNTRATAEKSFWYQTWPISSVVLISKKITMDAPNHYFQQTL